MLETAEKLYPIKNYEGLYSINKEGNVWKHPRIKGNGTQIKGAWISQSTSGGSRRGVMSVSLYKDGRHYRKDVHRLLAEAFIPNPENKRCIRHLDGNHSNNSLDNLAWITNRQPFPKKELTDVEIKNKFVMPEPKTFRVIKTGPLADIYRYTLNKMARA